MITCFSSFTVSLIFGIIFSIRIKQLEKSLGYDLFHRTNRGVILSIEGEKLYPLAVEIVKKIKSPKIQYSHIRMVV